MERKAIRLKGFDYNDPGWYFLTICTKGKIKLLCDIVGTGLLDGPQVQLTDYGVVADQQLRLMADFYENMKLERYTIMPNHVHLLLRLLETENGPSGRPVPTNSGIAKFVGTFKRFCNRQYGENIWQNRSYDHIIRDEADFLKHVQYIDQNPARWTEDELYIP